MEIKHAKVGCTSAQVVRFGGRRRCCTNCGVAWRIRLKKRGRRRRRSSSEFVLRYFRHEIPSLRGLAQRKHQSRRCLELRLRRSRDFFLAHTPWPMIPETGPLIVIADAIVFQHQGRWYTSHLFLVRSPDDLEAVILPPVILAGTETSTSWAIAFATIPAEVLTRIKALVCDGHRGLVYFAARQHWIIQRCHFHLLAAVSGRRSRFGRSRHREEGQRIYELVKRVLLTTDETQVPTLLNQIDDEALSTSSPELRRYLRGFVNAWEDFRSYQYHPELHLPTTNNTAESLAGCLRELLHRARGFSSLGAIEKWFAAFVKYKKTIK